MVNSRTYHTSDLSKDFAVNPMTVRNWAVKFADHLSDDANPPKGDTRAFTLEDAQVLSLVAQFIKHKSPEEIHARLRNGEVGTFPLITSAGLDTRDSPGSIQLLEQKVEELQMALNLVIKERDDLRTQLDPTQESVIKLNTQVAVLTEMLAAERQRAEDAYARGIREGMVLITHPPTPNSRPSTEDPKPTADAAAPAPAEGQGG